MNTAIIVNSAKNIGPVVGKFICANKGKILTVLPYGGLACLLGYEIYRSEKQKEKDNLYQKHIQKTDAIIKDLEKKASKVDYLEYVNEMLLDTVIEHRKNNFMEA